MMKSFLPLLAAAGLAVAGCNQVASAAEPVVAAPAALKKSKESGLKTAIFAGGCFWGVEGVFSRVKGVRSAVSGYHGGNEATATYDRVNSGVTGHAEAVRVTYDPSQIRYDQLLRIFFSVVADPTLKNRQGPDRGSQYRAALVPMSDDQRAVAAAYLKQMGRSGKWNAPIVTQLETYKKFYPAEAYHQDFMEKNPRHSYITRWDAPKVRALAQMYPAVHRATFVKD
ncbi:peptide-methionine (S)-S-oxide reductase MsrA [Pseudopontixanthobacter vadosimaris]|uniref:peptide-methionine (S)-S-oxide reductase MsrA n=1 Tax=Pseudopontixanthobacter vadosimaris TaxID=2726450 RepID=UPI001474BDB3|nr:peptide-methionine (S)-S-oxide reductase MsrA [Pseudopontixanthobacter vadosimaris]